MVSRIHLLTRMTKRTWIICAACAALLAAFVATTQAATDSGHYGYTKNCPAGTPGPLCAITVAGHAFYQLYGNDTDKGMYIACTIWADPKHNAGLGYGACSTSLSGNEVKNSYAEVRTQYTTSSAQTIGWLGYYNGS